MVSRLFRDPVIREQIDYRSTFFFCNRLIPDVIILGFIPYLTLYLLAWLLNIRLWLLRDLFWILHIGTGIIVFRMVLRNRGQWELPHIIFWGLLLLAFLVPGAFLEYPTDVWAHLHRMSSFDPMLTVSESETPWKFSYFWGWTFLSLVPMTLKRYFIDAYSTFWQMLLAIQLYRFARALGQNRSLSYLQVVGFFTLFGSNVFTFRYYALSSTALAYSVYLGALVVCVGPSPQRGYLLLASALLLMVFNHIQEPLLLLINGGTIFFFWHALHLAPERRNRVVRYCGIFLIVLLIPAAFFGYFAKTEFFPFWRLRSFYLDTYGVHGAVSLVLAFIWRRKYPLLSALSLAPSLLLCYPPTAIILHRLLGEYATFRVLYATPLSLFLVTCIYDLSKVALQAPVLSRYRWTASILAILLMAIPARFPWRGRLYFQLYRAPHTLDLRGQEPTARWIHTNRSPSFSAGLFTDPLTAHALTFYLGRAVGFPVAFQGHRLAPEIFLWWQSPVFRGKDVWEFMQRHEIKRLLVVDRGLAPSPPDSRLRKLSEHWTHGTVGFDLSISPMLVQTCDGLAQKWKWSKTPVPPFYYLYEPTDN